MTEEAGQGKLRKGEQGIVQVSGGNLCPKCQNGMLRTNLFRVTKSRLLQGASSMEATGQLVGFVEACPWCGFRARWEVDLAGQPRFIEDNQAAPVLGVTAASTLHTTGTLHTNGEGA